MGWDGMEWEVWDGMYPELMTGGLDAAALALDATEP